MPDALTLPALHRRKGGRGAKLDAAAKVKTVSISWDPELLAALDAYAAEHTRGSRSQALDSIVRTFLFLAR